MTTLTHFATPEEIRQPRRQKNDGGRRMGKITHDVSGSENSKRTDFLALAAIGDWNERWGTNHGEMASEWNNMACIYIYIYSRMHQRGAE
jgi:hypothetical protein